jgi:WD40 repeat protein
MLGPSWARRFHRSPWLRPCRSRTTEELFSELYDELRKIAAQRMAHERWPAHDQKITALAFSRDGRKLISASLDQRAATWSVPDRRLLGAYLPHQGAVSDVAMSADGHWAVTASRDGTAQRWKVEDGRPVGAPLLTRTRRSGFRHPSGTIPTSRGKQRSGNSHGDNASPPRMPWNRIWGATSSIRSFGSPPRSC